MFIFFQGEIGIYATTMVTELIRDNRQIVDRMQNHHIDSFIQLLFKNQVSLLYNLTCLLIEQVQCPRKDYPKLPLRDIQSVADVCWFLLITVSPTTYSEILNTVLLIYFAVDFVHYRMINTSGEKLLFSKFRLWLRAKRINWERNAKKRG